MSSSIIFGFLIVAFNAALLDASEKVYAIDLLHFGEGKTIVATYTVPSSSRTNVNLQDDTGRVVLHLDYRKDWTFGVTRWQNTLYVITTNDDGTWDWGNAKSITDFNYESGTDITFRIEAKSGAFDIKVNNKLITSSDYVVPVDTIKRVYMETEADDCELKSLQVEI